MNSGGVTHHINPCSTKPPGLSWVLEDCIKSFAARKWISSSVQYPRHNCRRKRQLRRQTGSSATHIKLSKELDSREVPRSLRRDGVV